VKFRLYGMTVRRISNPAWNAVLRRDRGYDGKFVYVAITTGIYCRPSCPSRRPLRRHALFFSTAAEAERAGYVACLRCHPNSLTPAEESVKAALDFVQQHIDRRITLNELSKVSGLSSNHLQETFKRIVGVSPKAFYNAQRLIRFKQLVRAGESVSSACYGVGYGSSRALYENAMRWLGMTPGTYQRRGKGTVIRYTIIQTSLGRVLLAGTTLGISRVCLGHDDGLLLHDLQDEFCLALLLRDQKAFRKWEATVRFCEAEDPFLSRLPAAARCRIFETKLWALIALHN
jgi:AraC family transcriptional regulator, regulatory protein of adaptative response / methylated-DNA-[protein]-cysteine methyltransferase